MLKSKDEWIKKKRYIRQMEYHSVIQRDEFLPFSITWMDSREVQ